MRSVQEIRLNIYLKICRAIAKTFPGLLDKVHYINGAETLPLPLSPAEEARIIAQLAEGDEGVKKTLIEHNLRLVVYIARKFESTGVGIEDLISIGAIGLIKAINTFKPDKT